MIIKKLIHVTAILYVQVQWKFHRHVYPLPYWPPQVSRFIKIEFFRFRSFICYSHKLIKCSCFHSISECGLDSLHREKQCSHSAVLTSMIRAMVTSNAKLGNNVVRLPLHFTVSLRKQLFEDYPFWTQFFCGDVCFIPRTIPDSCGSFEGSSIEKASNSTTSGNLLVNCVTKTVTYFS